jgi:hypothetical protein
MYGARCITMNPPLVTRLMMVGLRKAAMALAAVIAMELPKYMYVDLILSFTYWGHKLRIIKS